MVFGMHRGGTSATTRALYLMGCDGPRTLMQPMPDNPSGFWESEPVQVLNDAVFAACGTTWDCWSMQDMDWFDSAAAVPYRKQARALLQNEFDGSSPLFALKDPRISRLLPLWVDAMRSIGTEPRVLVALRNPLNVAASLWERDRIPVSAGYLIWLRYMLDAEFASRGLRRVYSCYEELLLRPGVVMERIAGTLGVVWPKAGQASAQAALDDFLSTSQCHHWNSDEEFASKPALAASWLGEVYTILTRWAKGEVCKEDITVLDHIRASFDANTETILETMLSDSESALRQTRQDLKQTQAELAELHSSRSWRLVQRFRSIWRQPRHPVKPGMAEANEVLWQMDQCLIQDSSFNLHGWLLHRGTVLEGLDLQHYRGKQLIDAWPLRCLLYRKDIAAAYPSIPHARHSGFHSMGILCDYGRDSRLVLSARFADGRCISLPVPQDWIVEKGIQHLFRHRFLYRARKAVSLLKAGRFGYLASRLVWYLRSLWRAQGSVDGRELRLGEKDRLAVLFDQDMGGGANYCRERLIEEMGAKGIGVLLILWNVSRLQHLLELRSGQGRQVYRFSNLSQLEQILTQDGFRPERLIYNNLVSFPFPEQTVSLIGRMKRAFAVPLVIMAHDFFVLCPSFHLLDADGKYCGVPEDLEQCRACLPRNRWLVGMSAVGRDIGQWRSDWGKLLAIADEVRCFSQSSMRILLKAYPHVSHKVRVRPHGLGHDFPVRKPVPRYRETLRIGVIGSISIAKGADIVNALAQELERQGQDIGIVVIGVLEAPADDCRKRIRQTGSYRRHELPRHIEESGVNVVLFPTICPETYSFVCHECVALGLPLACFDLGAQAEVVREYRQGHILSSMEPAVILEELTALHHRCYLSTEEGRVGAGACI